MEFIPQIIEYLAEASAHVDMRAATPILLVGSVVAGGAWLATRRKKADRT